MRHADDDIHARFRLETCGNPAGGIIGFLAERAEGQGLTSLHLIVLAAKGKQLRFAVAGKPPQPAPIELDGAAFKLLAGAGATDGSWSLFDLRSLRPGLRKLVAGDIDMLNLINGYDFALVIPEGSASTQLAASLETEPGQDANLGMLDGFN